MYSHVSLSTLGRGQSQITSIQNISGGLALLPCLAFHLVLVASMYSYCMWFWPLWGGAKVNQHPFRTYQRTCSFAMSSASPCAGSIHVHPCDFGHFVEWSKSINICPAYISRTCSFAMFSDSPCDGRTHVHKRWHTMIKPTHSISTFPFWGVARILKDLKHPWTPSWWIHLH